MDILNFSRASFARTLYLVPGNQSGMYRTTKGLVADGRSDAYTRTYGDGINEEFSRHQYRRCRVYGLDVRFHESVIGRLGVDPVGH